MISIDTEEVLDKIQEPFSWILTKLGIEKHFLNFEKNMYKYPQQHDT